MNEYLNKLDTNMTFHDCKNNEHNCDEYEWFVFLNEDDNRFDTSYKKGSIVVGKKPNDDIPYYWEDYDYLIKEKYQQECYNQQE
jgi:hypothetical protein